MNKGMVDVMKIAGFILAVALIGMYILGCDLAPKYNHPTDRIGSLYNSNGYPVIEVYRDHSLHTTCYVANAGLPAISCIRD